MKLSQSLEGELKIEGIDDADKFVTINGPKAHQLADIALHEADLSMADSHLDAINRISMDEREIREALYIAAVIRYLKCFGRKNAARKAFTLSESVVFASEPDGLACFNELKAIRDKHLAHDENSLAQCVVGLVLNDGTKKYKIEKVVALSTFVALVNESDWKNLKLLISRTREFVVQERERLCQEITEEMELFEYAELAVRSPVIIRPALQEDIGKNRDNSHLL